MTTISTRNSAETSPRLLADEKRPIPTDAARPEVFITLDESHYQLESQPHIYAVGAVVVEGSTSFTDLETMLTDLRQRVAYTPALLGNPESSRIENQGWHLTEDQISTAEHLWHFMGEAPDIKYHYRYFLSKEHLKSKQLVRAYAILHASLVRDLLPRYARNPHITFAFEQFDALNSKYDGLVRFCAGRLDGLKTKPTITVQVLEKGESNLSSVVDYMTLGVSRLIGASEKICEKDPACGGQCRNTLFENGATTLGHLRTQDFNFRNFQNVVGSLSSARAIRLHSGVLSRAEERSA